MPWPLQSQQGPCCKKRRDRRKQSKQIEVSQQPEAFSLYSCKALIRLRALLKTKIDMLLFMRNDRFSNKRSLRGKPAEEGKRTVWIDGKTDARSVNYSVQCVYDTAFNLGPEPKTFLPGGESKPYCTQTGANQRKNGSEGKVCPVECG